MTNKHQIQERKFNTPTRKSKHNFNNFKIVTLVDRCSESRLLLLQSGNHHDVVAAMQGGLASLGLIKARTKQIDDPAGLGEQN